MVVVLTAPLMSEESLNVTVLLTFWNEIEREGRCVKPNTDVDGFGFGFDHLYLTGLVASDVTSCW
jgi:hypothetical protein